MIWYFILRGSYFDNICWWEERITLCSRVTESWYASDSFHYSTFYNNSVYSYMICLNSIQPYFFVCKNLLDISEAHLHEVTLNLHTHVWIFSCMSIVTVDGKQHHLSEVVFSALVGFSLYTTSTHHRVKQSLQGCPPSPTWCCVAQETVVVVNRQLAPPSRQCSSTFLAVESDFFLAKNQTPVVCQAPYSPDIRRYRQNILNQVRCSNRSVIFLTMKIQREQ